MTEGPAVAAQLAVGDEVEMEIGAVAHGGSCVARVHGRVVFVRYALPGERAVVRITEAKRGSFCRGEAVDILRPDPRRVPAPCAHFGPGGCGGCDFQHADSELQRELKAAVIAEQFERLAGIDVSVVVEPLPGGELEWRGRVRWGISPRPGPGGGSHDGVRVATPPGTIGPRRYRSTELVAVTPAEPCLIADPEFSELASTLRPPAWAQEVVLARRAGAPPAVAYLGRGRPAPVAQDEVVRGRDFRVETAGFWQAHREAAAVFCQAVAEVLADFAARGGRVLGGAAWDLYGGVGLFAAVLAEAVGEQGRVISVESDAAASSHAAANLSDLPQATAVRGRVDHFVAAPGDPVDVVLLDPPRSGAGAAVCRDIAAHRPALIVYVACDPAALARDTAALGEAGYALVSLRAFDAFPQTHHVECLAVFAAHA